MIDQEKILRIVEAALLTTESPMEVKDLVDLFKDDELEKDIATKTIRDVLNVIQNECEQRSMELKRVASGYRFQVRQEYSEWIGRMLTDRPPRYTRALLETLAIVVYKQPVTRGDIEELRGVSVSQNIMRTLLERGWIKSVGQKEVPGRPALYATTKEFLDYFDLKNINELPEISEIQELVIKEIEAGNKELVEEIPLNLENDSSVDTQPDQCSDSALEEEKALSNVVNLPLNQ
jgi:segregation and condensation protein B